MRDQDFRVVTIISDERTHAQKRVLVDVNAIESRQYAAAECPCQSRVVIGMSDGTEVLMTADEARRLA